MECARVNYQKACSGYRTTNGSVSNINSCHIFGKTKRALVGGRQYRREHTGMISIFTCVRAMRLASALGYLVKREVIGDRDCGIAIGNYFIAQMINNL